MNPACVCPSERHRRCGVHGEITATMRAAARAGRPIAEPAPFVKDADLTIHVGDCLDVLGTFEDGSVDCVVTSPPYWGLRDYGTGSWDGGDPDCDHEVVGGRAIPAVTHWNKGGVYDPEKRQEVQPAQILGGSCGKCGARRVDQQLGLEPTPDEYVARMVAVFREVRRVLAPHGTCWVNLGDSYAASLTSDRRMFQPTRDNDRSGGVAQRREPQIDARRTAVGELKPKDLVGIPWRVAFALQADGWYLRSDIIWSKPNPMPESVTDRPTKAHEYVFLLSKGPRYFFDAEAVREKAKDWTRGGPGVGIAETQHYGAGNGGNAGLSALAARYKDGAVASGRNVRSVWEIATQPYAGAHFATYPEELVRRCVLAGCAAEVCRTCGKPRERIVEATYENPGNRTTNGPRSIAHRHSISAGYAQRLERRSETTGWSDCGHNDYRPGIVLDPFLGSGTTALVARKHGRHAIGIELNEEYARLAAERTKQLSLLGDLA